MRANRIRVAVASVVLVLFGGGCGADTTTGTGGEGPATTSTTLQSSITTESSASTDSAGLDEALADRSLLSLGVDPTSPGSGRFLLERGLRGYFVMTVTGRYWVTASGNVYTELDVDADLIADEMELLADHIASPKGMSENSGYLASLRNHYQGSEFQIGLADLARWAGIGGVSVEFIDQMIWLGEYQAEDPFPPELFQCRTAIEEFDSVARDWATELEIEFTPDQGGASGWVFPVHAFDDALADEHAAAEVCDVFFGPADTQPDLWISVTSEQEARRIEVLVDLKTSIDKNPEPMLSVTMWPDNSAGDPPQAPAAAPLLSLRGTYLTAIGVCGQLPTNYSNFMAGDSYSHPGNRGYLGPSIFESDWLCPE